MRPTPRLFVLAGVWAPTLDGAELPQNPRVWNWVSVQGVALPPGCHHRSASRLQMEGPDEAVPPVVTCARCGRTDCPGCVPVTVNEVAINLAWETRGNLTERLWATSLDTSTRPEAVFGQLTDGSLVSATAFAFISEGLAVGSLAALTVLAALAVAPAFAHSVLRDVAACVLGVEVFLGLVLLLVALHAVWGLFMELGAAMTGISPRWRLGARFGLYACGWDLQTSPAGIVHGLLARGLRGALGPVGSAVRVPRRAMRAYMVLARNYHAQAQRRATFLATLALAVVMLALVVGLVTLAVRIALAL